MAIFSHQKQRHHHHHQKKEVGGAAEKGGGGQASKPLARSSCKFVAVLLCTLWLLGTLSNGGWGGVAAASSSSKERFTALVELADHKIVEAQKLLAEQLARHSQSQRSRLRSLSHLMDALIRHQTQVNAQLQKNAASQVLQTNTDKVEGLLTHPLNIFHFIARFPRNWPAILHEYIKSNEEWSEDKGRRLADWLQTIFDQHFPGRRDLAGIGDALHRLQTTYKIPPGNLSSAAFLHELVPTNRGQLNAEDLFEMGKKFLKQNRIAHMVSWMQHAYELMLSREQHESTLAQKDVELLEQIIDYLIFGYYKQGVYSQTMALLRHWIAINPNSTRALENYEAYRKFVKTEPVFEKLMQNIKSEPRQKPVNRRYEALCRGEHVASIPSIHIYPHLQPKHPPVQLTCRYFVPHPMFVLQPIKEETLYDDPRLVMYYDVISDEEIDHIKEMATPLLKRATIQDPATGELVYADYRISQSAWLNTKHSPVTEAIDRRIEAMTGLNIDTAEPLQIVNYGIGGQYEPHYDMSTKDDAGGFEEKIGNRIATLIYYLSDISKGGPTAFTDIGAKVYPRKGSAAFWWNLLPSGQEDMRTRHAGCPVLSGSKWVMNKWFHERGQEFRRPCGLDKRQTLVRMTNAWPV